MKLVFHSRCLTALLVLAAATCPSAAEPQEEPEELDELLEEEFSLLEDAAQVVESAARHEQQLGMSPSAVTIITRKDIEVSGAHRLVDVLRLVPGLDVILATPAFSALGLRTVWSHKNNFILVLVDGREMTVEFMGMPFLEMLPISLDDIERIEVIKGPGSALYGANAFSGVVSIFTRSVAEKTAAHVHLGGGEMGAVFASGKFSTWLKDLGFSLAAATDHWRDFMDVNARGIQSLRLRAVGEWKLTDAQRLLLDASMAQGRGPIPTNIGTFDGELRVTTVRADYEAKSLKSHLYWTLVNACPHFDIPLVYNDILLARISDTAADGHVLDGEVQWMLPELWQPLLLIVGAGGRLSTVFSDQLLDADSYSDPASSRYHQVGIEHWEGRAGTFLHAELKPFAWITVTAGGRLDYNSETGTFLSPRLAAVIRPDERHFVRLGVGRSFRKPSFMETDLHPDVSFPADSPIVGGDQIAFREFMTRVVGADGLANEELLSFEAGYLGYFWEEHLRLRLDLYYNMLFNYLSMFPAIEIDPRGLPDLRTSSFQFTNTADRLDSFGGELELTLEISPSLSLSAWWAYREVKLQGTSVERMIDQSPKNLLGLGLRYWSERGFIGSLYFFVRSEFLDVAVDNPAGLMAPLLQQKMDPLLVAMSKLGWRQKLPAGIEIETGLKLFQPVSLGGSSRFCAREKGGIIGPEGRNFSGELLCRMVLFYLEGAM